MTKQKNPLILYICICIMILLSLLARESMTAGELAKEYEKEYIAIEKIASTKKIQGLWGGFSLSPDGKWIALDSNIAGNPDIWIVPSKGGWPRQLTTSKQRDLFPVWSPDGGKIAYVQDKEGNEVFDIWVIPLSRGEAKNLTRSLNVDERTPHWSPDGEKIAFASDKNGNLDIFIMTAKGKEITQLTHHPAPELYPKWSPDGKYILFERRLGNNESELVCVHGEGGQTRVLASLSDSHNRYAQWSPDGSQIVFSSNRSGFYNLGLIDFATGKIIWLTEGNWDKTDPAWLPDGSQVAYSCNIDGQIDIFILSIEKRKIKKLPADPGVNTVPQWFSDGKRLAFLHESTTEPRDIWVCLIDGEKPKQISFSFVGGLKKDDLIRGKLIHYPSFDGHKISAYLFRPREIDEGKKHQAVIWVHGGPDWQFFDFWYPIALGFANQGFVVLCPNYRGSTGYGREFEMMNDKDWGGNDLKDVVAGAQYLIKNGFADPRKIAIAGKSYGGYMTYTALTKTPDIWAAGVAFMGPVNMVTMYRTYRGPAKSSLEGEMGTPEDNADLYYDRSPINFVKKIKAPLLAIYGATDTRVTIDEWEQLKEALDKYNKSYEFIVFQDEGHFFGNTENLVYAMKQAVEFLRKCFDQ